MDGKWGKLHGVVRCIGLYMPHFIGNSLIIHIQVLGCHLLAIELPGPIHLRRGERTAMTPSMM
jgi:hypothetical protein